MEGTKLCLRGSTLDDFMQAHPNLRSSRAIAKMKLRARLHKSNMVKIESLHASLRRLIISRSIQTHGQEFTELCGEWLCGRIRLRAQTCINVESGAVTYNGSAGADGDGDSSLAKRKEFKRNPNPWNAHQHLKALESRSAGAVSRRVVKDRIPANTAIGYNDLDADGHDSLRDRCNVAKMARRDPAHVGTSFGLSINQSRRAAMKSKFAEIGDGMVLALPMAGDEEPSKFETAALCVRNAMDNPDCTSLQSTIKAATCMMLAHKRARTRQRKADMAIVRRYHEEIALPKAGAFFNTHSSLKPLACDFQSVPCAQGELVLGYVPDPVTVVNVCALASHSTHQEDDDSMAVVCDTFTEGLSMVMHDECPPIRRKPARKARKPPCDRENVCLCGEAGDTTYAFRNRFALCGR